MTARPFGERSVKYSFVQPEFGFIGNLGVCAAENFAGTAIPETVDIVQTTGEAIPCSAGYSPIVGTMVHLKASAVFHGADS